MKNEYRLLLNVVLKNKSVEEEKQIDELLRGPLDWELVGGQILRHRLGGYFLSGLKKEQKKYAPYEFIKALELLVLAQKKQSLEILNVIRPILDVFETEGIRYAALKGLVFNASLYNPGDRRSNDTDLLVYEDDLDKLDYILRKFDYIQSFMVDGEFKEASRKEKLIQRMNYHDLVPYVKLLDNEFVNRHDIDINFHFDSKDNDITLAVLNRGTTFYKNALYSVRGLPWETNLAHLCIHFYREATNSIWTDGKRDVILYKLVDIINTIRSCKDENLINEWPELMIKLNLQKAAYYTLHTLLQFYNDSVTQTLKEKLEPSDISFLYEVKIEGENKIVKRTESFVETAFDLKNVNCL